MPTNICPQGHTFEKTSNCPTCPVCAQNENKQAYANGFPRIGAPAYRALKEHKISLDDLPAYTEEQLLELHGIGPRAVRILREYLQEKGKSFTSN